MSSNQELNMKSNERKSNIEERSLDLTTGEIIYQLKELENGEKRITMASVSEAYAYTKSSTKITQKDLMDSKY